MKKLVFALITLLVMLFAFTFSACGGKDDNSSDNTVSFVEDIECSVPYIVNLKCEYLSRPIDTEAKSLIKNTKFSYKDVIYVKVDFKITEEAIENGIKDVTFKLGVPDGFNTTRSSANTSNFGNEELSYKYGTDASRKECSIIVKVEFLLSEGEITFDFKFDDGEYITANEVPILNKDALNYTYLSDIDAYEVSCTETFTVEDVKIPSTYNGKPIKKISGFSGKTFIKSIELPNSITEIGENAFKGCYSIKEIIISENVTRIGGYAFSGCTSLNTAFWNATKCTNAGSSSAPIFDGCSNLKTVVIGEKVQSISSSAFSGCPIESATMPIKFIKYIPKDNLKTVIINGGNSIDYEAFTVCGSITSVKIGNSVTTIGIHAFYNCSSLTSIEIGESVKWIGFGAFYGCKSLTSLVIDNNNKNYHVKDNCLIETATNTLVLARENCIIPDYVDFIGDNAFADCGSITSIVLPSNVLSIGKYAFAECTSLTSIVLPSNVWTIDYYAFRDCTSLTSIVLPSRVTAISDSLFYNCESLTSIEIRGSVTSIGDMAFEKCSSLLGIVLPNSVTSIGDSAFRDCVSLTSIVLPNSVTTLCGRAFCNCNKLTSIEIGESVTNIGYSAFFGCESLTSIEIPNSVTSIGSAAFNNCTSLTSITYNGTIAKWKTITKDNNWNYNLPNTCKVHCSDGEVDI